MKYKKLISIIVILVLMITNITYAENSADVNVSSYDPHWGTSYASEIEKKNYKIARISLWNTKNNTLCDVKNICDVETSTSREFLFVSDMTKVEIAKENGSLPFKIYSSMNDNVIFSNMHDQAISLPELIISKGESASSFSNNLNSWFSKKENVNILLSSFENLDNEDLRKWNKKELCLIIEPMISLVSHSGILFWKKEKVSCFTCAEIGVITNQELYRDLFKTTGSKNYHESCYKGLPFSCFKLDKGALEILPPYNTSSSDGFCDPYNSRDMLDMIESLGCFELVSNKKIVGEKIEPKISKSSDIEYYTNTWVITSVDVSSNKGFPYQSDSAGSDECSNNAKNNCLSGSGLVKIYYNFSCDNEDLEISEFTQSLAIPQSGYAISWVKWKTPAYPCKVSLNITTNSSDADLSSDEIEFNIIDPEDNTYPPNTEGTDRNDYFINSNRAYGSWDVGENLNSSWSTYDYNWHYDWHCICKETSHGEICGNEISLAEYNEYGSSGGWDYEEEETASGKTKRVKVYWNICNTCSCNYGDVGENHKHKHCTFSKEDWGWVEWNEVKHTASLNINNIDLKRSSHSPDTNNSDYSIKSGYGIELDIDTAISNKVAGAYKSINSSNNEITPPQFMETYLPEYYYEDYKIVSKKNLDEDYTANNHFNFPTNPYSQFEQNCHFTPVWFPDGEYVIGIRISQCWTPAGMLYKCLYDTSINIEGNVYDDWHIAPERN